MGKAYKNSDCTMIALMDWLKRIIIVKKLTLVIDFSALLSSCWSPLLTLIDRSCDVTYVTMHMLGHNNDVTDCSSVCKWVLAELFCVWKLEI